MDSSVHALLSTAQTNVKKAKVIENKEREDFEDFMIDKMLQGDPELKLYLLSRCCECEDKYADDHINFIWWVWKSRAEIARNEIPEAYPVDVF